MFRMIIVTIFVSMMLSCSCVRDNIMLPMSDEDVISHMVKIDIGNGRGFCSGAKVGSKTFITAFHCKNDLMRINGKLMTVNMNVKTGADIIVLNGEDENESWLQFYTSNFPIIGEEYRLLGYPNMNKEVVVRKVKFLGVYSGFGAAGLAFEGMALPGDSGGIVVDTYGRIVGITSALLGSNTILIAPVFALSNYLKDYEKK